MKKVILALVIVLIGSSFSFAATEAKEIAKIHFNRLTMSNIEADRKSTEVLKNAGIKIVYFKNPKTDLIQMGKKARESDVGEVYSRELLDRTLSLLEEYRRNH